MAVSGVGGTVPELQTSWTRSEAACAAKHRGDVYYELTHPPAKTPYTADDTKSLGARFTLYL